MSSTTKNSRCPNREQNLGPGRGVDLLTVAFVLVLVGIVLWVVVGPMINPCLGVTEGGRIQDPDHPERVLVCKR